MRNFWSAHLRFFQQLCMGAKVDRIVQEAQQALADGQCVVIGYAVPDFRCCNNMFLDPRCCRLQSTGESGTESFIEKGLWNRESMISTAAAFLHNVVCCPTYLCSGLYARESCVCRNRYTRRSRWAMSLRQRKMPCRSWKKCANALTKD